MCVKFFVYEKVMLLIGMWFVQSKMRESRMGVFLGVFVVLAKIRTQRQTDTDMFSKNVYLIVRV